MKRTLALALVGIAGAAMLTGCSSQADTVSDNLSNDADNFKVERRVVFINGITDKYLLEIEGLCSLGNADKGGELSVTCKVGPDSYKKHFLGLSDNVTYLVEQLDPRTSDPYHYQLNFKPEELIPDVQLHTSLNGQ